MLLLIQIFLVHLLACDPAEADPVTSLNPGCNYAGICYPITNKAICGCCRPETQFENTYCGEHWTCDPENPLEGCVKFADNTCTSIEQYFYTTFGFRAEDNDPSAPSDISCDTVPYERATYNFYRNRSFDIGPQVQYVARKFGWPGTITSVLQCDTCSPDYPCILGVDHEVNATAGSTYGFQADFQEWYNLSCGTGATLYSPEMTKDCAANYDYGQLGHLNWENARGDIGSGDTSFIDELNLLLQAEPNADNNYLGLRWNNTVILGMGEQDTKSTVEDIVLRAPTLLPTTTPSLSPTEAPSQSPTGSPTETPSQSPTGSPTERPSHSPSTSPTERPSLSPTNNPTEAPTESPTPSPTASPTNMPTRSPTLTCGPYVNEVEDLVFEGVGSDCRAGLNTSWPGGLSCDSPYIVCLPLENTPGEFGGEPYKSTTHRYSVDECLQECANDQRCMGVEFVADFSSALGNCNLIDDIPLKINSTVSGFVFDPETSYSNLDETITNGNAMCFVKQGACNPHFEAGDLNEVMLNCYCPNNRKGSYTKKVKRTVSNTRFCGDDSEVDIRIQKAQANRMFHLCENWCLFLTDDPEAESWYWDPWKTCWREQYAGVGAHMSYCSRVIRNPDTIEMQFLTHRSTMCRSEKPTEAPSALASSWYLANEEDSCDDVCNSYNMVCDENLVASAIHRSQLETYFEAAGVTCESMAIGEEGWALPGYHISSQSCLARNIVTENTPCNWAIGVGYRRLCACVN